MFDKRLIQLVPGVMRYIGASVALKWVALVANICIITTLGQAIAGFIGSGPTVLIEPGALGFLAAAILIRSAAIYLAQRCGDRAAFAAKRAIRQRVYDKLAALGPAYAESVSTAEAVQTSVEGAQQLEVYFGGYLPQLFYAALAPLTLFALLVGTAPVPATVLLVIVPLIPASIMVVMRNAKKVAAEYWGSYVDLGGSFLEAVQGLTTLKIYQADARWHERMNHEAEGFRQATMKMLRVQLNSINVMDLVAFGGAAAGIIVAVAQLSVGALSFTAAFSVVFLSQEFFLPMRRLGSLFHTAMNGMSAAKTMFRILDTPAPERGSAELSVGEGISCEGAGYAYGDHVVLAGVTCEIPRGSLTAIVGESGSGKSTLAGILSGRKAAYRGRLSIGGVDVRDASLDSLMRTVTLVPTNGHLFAGTLRENLLLAKGDATDEELMSALARCRVDGFVRVNGGLDMVIEEGGSNLSGGQRQRVVAARALLHDTPIYVFDEATSNVDAESERAIDEMVRELAGERTVIVIAHRLASIAAADQILVMDAGHLVERGTHTDLLAACGRYAELWESQSELEALAAQQDTAASPAAPASPASSSSALPAASSPAARPADMPAGTRGAATPTAGEPGMPTDLAANQPSPAPVPNEARLAVASLASRQPATSRTPLSIMLRMVGLVSPLMPYLVLAIILGSAGSLSATFLVTFGAYGLMAGIGSVAPLTVLAACILVAVCGIVRGPLHYGEQLCNHYIAFRLLAHVRDHVFAALRRLAPAKLEGRERGDLISLLTADIELLEVFYAHTLSPIAIALVTSLAMLAFIGAHSPLLAGIALFGYVALGIVLPVASSKLCGSAGRASRDGAGAISAYVLDSLRGLFESIQFGVTAARSRGLERRTEATGAHDRSLQRRMAAVEGVADAAVLSLSLLMVGAAFGQCAAGALTVEAAFVSAFAFFSSFGPVLAVARLGTSLQATLASGARVLDLLDEEPETDEVAEGEGVSLDPAAFSGAGVEGVGFSYAACGERILSDVTLEIPAGQMTCIAGRSGSGKSTLLKLLMRFWDPTSGTVRVSGEDARRVATASLRACEGYMTQDTHLFVGTVRENLQVARENATDAELDAACAAAALTGLIERLPQGYDTPVAELGDSLSGGERQRIGLARVFLHDAPLVLLDEPTSNLDALNEAAVMRAVAELRERGKTIVLVSHRASTASFADRTYSVERGRVS